MKIDDIEINGQAETTKVEGKGYAFLGGFVDLEPHNAKTIVIGWSVVLTATDHPEAWDSQMFFPAEQVDVGHDGRVTRRTTLTLQTYGKESPTYRALVDMAAHYETEKIVQPGFADALRSKLIELGVEPEEFEGG